MSRTEYPKSYEEMVAAKALIFPPVTFQIGKDFKPRPSDVIITPWSKSGTTWLQQIAHGQGQQMPLIGGQGVKQPLKRALLVF